MAAEITATLYPAGNLTTPVRTLELSTGRSWEEQLSEPGAGQLSLLNDLAQPVLGQLVAFDVKGARAWVMIAETFERVAADPNEEAAQRTTWSGRGHLAVCARGLVYPTNGLGAYPKQVDMHFDYRHPGYDDSAWVGATEIVSVDAAKSGGGSPWPIPWTDNMPGGASSSTKIIWDSSGSETSAPVGRVYFRDAFTTIWDGTYDLFFTADNSGEIYIDGCLICAAGGPGSIAEAGFTTSGDLSQWVHISPGSHVISGFGENWFPYAPGSSPGGIAYSLYIPGLIPQLVTESNSSTLILGYPSEPPGMTPGFAARLWLESVQARGDLTYVSLGCTDTHDSAGNVWAVSPTIATKILTDGLTFLREMSATYVDMRMRPTGFVLDLFNFATMGGTSGVAFLIGDNVTGLVQRGHYQVANVLIADYNGSFLEVEDTASVAVLGRHEAQFSIGAVDTPEEALRVLTEALGTYANPREEITVTADIPDSPTGYIDYQLGDTATTTDSTDTLVTERVTAIAVKDDADDVGTVITTPTLKDLLI